MKNNKEKSVLLAPVNRVEKKTAVTPKTNEQYGFYFSSSLKITDPDTGKVIVQMRCD